MAIQHDFDLVDIDGIYCGSGHVMSYTPAIESGRFTEAYCEHGETGPTIDDYRLWCRVCKLFVSESYGACPVNGHHRLVRRTD